MIDPTPFITGLVGTFSAYLTYKAAVVKAEVEQIAPPVKTDEITKGEAVAPVVQTAIASHGTVDDQADLANFQRNPQRYAAAMTTMLADLAARVPAVADQFQTLAQNAGIEGSGIQGNVNVSGEGKIYGTAVGVNTGSITGTYSFGTDDQHKK